MIDRDAVPIGHRPPYKRIDLSRPRRKEVITEIDVENGEIPDRALYEQDFVSRTWRLKR
jgi:hypothetical protein